jgi:uncharacterized protein
MAEYLSPGAYIEEIAAGPRPIAGVATSTAAFLGETERGVVWPALVTSYGDYQRRFGSAFAREKYMSDAARGFFANGGERLYVCRIVGANATTAHHDFGDLRVSAAGPGTWGRRVFVQILSSTKPDPDDPASAIRAGFRIQAAYWRSLPPGFVPFNPHDPAHQDKLRPDVMEDFDDLSLDGHSPNHFAKRVNGSSVLIALNLDQAPDRQPRIVASQGVMLDQGGNDGDVPSEAEYRGDAQHAAPTGLAALSLNTFYDVGLLHAPGVAGPAARPILRSIIDHCERLGRFAVLDSPRGVQDPTGLDPATDLGASRYAAFYYPWIVVADPDTGERRTIPPGGHVLGVYARVDRERGVFKAPANEVVREAVGLEFAIDERTSEQLASHGVNAIRRFPSRGILVWGARTLSPDSDWKYVNVRRLFIYLEHSIDQGTQWTVFEPNGPALWARVTRVIVDFLTAQWRQGALVGTRPQEAFFVRCDQTTMTQDDIDSGRLICQISIAPLRPAEFVLFRIGQWTAEHLS